MYQVLYFAYCLPEMKNEDLIITILSSPTASSLQYLMYHHFYFFACLSLITLNNMPQFLI